jgi:glycine oxidase
MVQPDVVVVGGGVIGASIAYYLSEQGVRVTLLERGQAGGHASLASAGLLHPLRRDDAVTALRELASASFALFPDLTARLHEVSGIDPEFRVSGWLLTATDEVESAELRAQSQRADPALGFRLISGDEAREMEPVLSPGIVAALHMPRGAQVYVPSYLQALTHTAARLGATIRRGVDVADLCVSEGRVTGVMTVDGEEIAAGHTVIAGGAWTAQTARRLGVSLPVFPLRGQIMSLYAVPAPLRRVVHGGEVYLSPKSDGSIVVGATYEDAGFDDRLTAEGMAYLFNSALRTAPGLANATFRQAWVGLRPASQDGIPILGAVPGWRDVAVATGHRAEGVLLSAITGQLMAQYLRGEATGLPLAPFDPGRFAI